MSYIKITLDSPETFLKTMLQTSLESGSDIILIDNKEDADVTLSVTEKKFVLSAQDYKSFILLPCRLEQLMKDIKNLYYKIHSQDVFIFDRCKISNHYLFCDDIKIELSKFEEMTLKLLHQAGEQGLEKNKLYEILGTGAESVIYRLRKKLVSFSVSIVLDKDYFKLNFE